MVLECVEKAVGIEDTRRGPCEMVAVILVLKLCYCHLECHPTVFGEVIYIVGHLSEHLLHCDTANGSIIRAHGYVLQVVQFAEDA